MSQPLFNQKLRQMRRERYLSSYDTHFFYQQIGERLISKLEDIKRKFKKIAILGANDCFLSDYFLRKGAEEITLFDSSDKLLKLFEGKEKFRLIHFEEDKLIAFPENSYDLMISNLYLGGINRLPALLKKIEKALKPDGFFLASFLGPKSFNELREAFMLAELHLGKGVAPHIAPMPAIDALGDLVQRAGFTLPVIERSFFEIQYQSFLQFFEDLRRSGESNSLIAQQKGMMGKRFFETLQRIYEEKFKKEVYSVSIELIEVSAWRAHPSQQKPLERGTAQIGFEAGLEIIKEKKKQKEEKG